VPREEVKKSDINKHIFSCRRVTSISFFKSTIFQEDTFDGSLRVYINLETYKEQSIHNKKIGINMKIKKLDCQVKKKAFC